MALKLAAAQGVAQHLNLSKITEFKGQIRESLVKQAAHRASQNVHLNAGSTSVKFVAISLLASAFAGVPGLVASQAILGAASAYSERAAYIAGKRSSSK